jgi:hypothetical protein
MTNKPAPTKFSPFVPSILKPMRVLLEEWGSLLVNADHRLLWVNSVAEAISGEYMSGANDLIVTVKKLEDTLARHRTRTKKKVEEDGESGTMSDGDKMFAQLLLDVQEYGRELTELGVSVSDCRSYQRLLSEAQNVCIGNSK